MSVHLPDGYALGHLAGHANYRGDLSQIVGEAKGPTNYGRVVVAMDAQFDADTNKTRVEFRFVDKTSASAR